APAPSGMRVTGDRSDARMLWRSCPPRVDTSTRAPSGVNLSRLAPCTFAANDDAVLLATSMTVIVPSWAFAAQICFPSGETSNPSALPPAGIVVALQLGRGPARFSKMVTLPDPTLVVTSRDKSGKA